MRKFRHGRNPLFALLTSAAGLLGCSGSDPSTVPLGAGGFTTSTGVLGSGGSIGPVETSSVGGNSAAIGSLTTNGTGGTTATSNGGSVPAAGGASQAAGGTLAAGGVGTSPKGGTSSTGGSKATGGTTAKGGTSSTGGTTAKGGTSSTGGTTAKGGTSSTGGTTATGGGSSCPFPTSFKWKDNSSGPIATPGNGWVSIKDFTNVVYNGQHLVYMSTHDNANYGSAMMAPFADWPAAATAAQTKLSTSTVAPELMYFAPKSTWILSYQWCASQFCYATSTNPTSANSWSYGKPLLTEKITGSSPTGPIDQVVICDSSNCYLFYADDNGHIYRASMPIGNFPGTFSGSKVIMTDTKANLFEAVEVYSVKGTGEYLMIVEAMGSGGRYFRAFRSNSLGGTFTAIAGASTESSPFAGKNNVTFTTNWTNDISHGDLVRTHDQTRTVDPCNLQLLYQGKNPSSSASYDLLPYRAGLLTKTN